MIRIAVDCFGGDKSPEANLAGALTALKQIPDVSLVLVGDENIIKKYLEDETYDKDRIEIVHAPQVISCDEKPTDAIRLKKDSSLVKATMMLRDDANLSGMVSIGSTGALVAAAVVRIGRIKNVIRPAFCPVIPTMNGRICGVCDSGANVDITPEHLQQYAVMGSTYLETVFGVKNPRVALLNIGAEAEKGDDLRKNAYVLLSKTKQINFVGNMEARELLAGAADLVVCDGFSGNVLIKSTEGAMVQMLKMLKRDIYSSPVNKFGALFMTGMFKKEKDFLNYQKYGGSVLIGCSKVIVKGHGSSNETAVAKCIEQAYKMKAAEMSGIIETKLQEIEDEKKKEAENV